MNDEYIISSYQSGVSIPKIAKQLKKSRNTISIILHQNNIMVSKLVDLTGNQFGKLTVLERTQKPSHLNGENRPYWLCLCECGKTTTVSSSNLRSGSMKSCSCSHYLYGKDHPMFGKEFTEEHRNNISKGVILSIDKISGSNHYNWKGGITPELIKIRRSKEYNDWRTSVFERDNYTCKDCGVHSIKGNPVILNAHHESSFSEYIDKRFDVDNGTTLCVDCHKLKHKRRQR